jgi:diguanylate cyclase (GGDEF)-like protein
MAQEIDRSIRYGRTLGLLIVDIDNFKLVNDVLGHDWGDIVLQKVAAQLGKTVRSVDFVARIGGEEFVIILPETDITGAVAAANRLLFAIRENPVETTKGLLPVTVSIGVNAGVATDPEDEKRLIADADQALYRAKKSGRDRLATVQDAEEADELLPATAQSA